MKWLWLSKVKLTNRQPGGVGAVQAGVSGLLCLHFITRCVLCMSLAAADQLFGSEIQQFTEEERWRVYRRKALGERSVETAFFYFVVLFNSFSGILPPFYLMVGWSRALQQVCLSGLFGRDLDQCIRCCLRFRKWSGKKGCLIARSRWCAENIVNIVHLKRYRFLQVGMF